MKILVFILAILSLVSCGSLNGLESKNDRIISKQDDLISSTQKLIDLNAAILNELRDSTKIQKALEELALSLNAKIGDIPGQIGQLHFKCAIKLKLGELDVSCNPS